MNATWIVVFMFVETAVALAVLNFVLRKRGGLAGLVAQLRQLAAVSAGLEQQVKDYLASSWSGDPAALPAAVEPLLAKLEADLAGRGIDVGRPRLKLLVARVIMRQGGTRAADLREAMKQVA